MTREEAEEVAKNTSKKEQCVQHVNCRFKSQSSGIPTEVEYYVSDWYNCDSTVASYGNGFKL